MVLARATLYHMPYNLAWNCTRHTNMRKLNTFGFAITPASVIAISRRPAITLRSVSAFLLRSMVMFLTYAQHRRIQ